MYGEAQMWHQYSCWGIIPSPIMHGSSSHKYVTLCTSNLHLISYKHIMHICATIIMCRHIAFINACNYTASGKPQEHCGKCIGCIRTDDCGQCAACKLALLSFCGRPRVILFMHDFSCRSTGDAASGMHKCM